MRKISQEEIRKILEDHELWIDSEGQEGRKADLSWADLSGANFSFADLTRANLSWAILSYSNLTGANLSGANLQGVHFYEADLSKADLRVVAAKGCWIRKAKFSSPKDRIRLLMLGAREV